MKPPDKLFVAIPYEIIDSYPLQISIIQEVGESEDTHWKYAIAAVRCLRTLSRRDVPLNPSLLKFFLENTYDEHPSVVSQ